MMDALRELHREAGTSLGLDPSGQRVNSSSTLRLMGVIPRSALRVLALQAGLRLRHEDGVVWLSEGIPTRFAAAPADVPPEWEAVWELRQERWAATGTALGELAGAIAGVTGLPVRCADGVEDATCWVLLQGLPLRAAVRAAATSAGVRVVFEDGALVFKRR